MYIVLIDTDRSTYWYEIHGGNNQGRQGICSWVAEYEMQYEIFSKRLFDMKILQSRLFYLVCVLIATSLDGLPWHLAYG